MSGPPAQNRMYGIRAEILCRDQHSCRRNGAVRATGPRPATAAAALLLDQGKIGCIGARTPGVCPTLPRAGPPRGPGPPGFGPAPSQVLPGSRSAQNQRDRCDGRGCSAAAAAALGQPTADWGGSLTAGGGCAQVIVATPELGV